MTTWLTSFLFMVVLCYESNAQATIDNKTQFHSRSFGVQGGLSLLENPFVLYPIVGLSYSQTALGFRRHQLAIFSQLDVIMLPTIETKFLFSTSLQYKYISKKRFESAIFLGLNYQLRKLAYDNYQFEDNVLKNKGSYLHQIGPIAGINIGYKLIKKKNYSVSPFFGVSMIKLNKSYKPGVLSGYKPNFTFGLFLNK
ncbi:hypothetical protein [Fibrella aquatilis]|uniref:Outer membrane protein beta-barrel domain-containing protein n=1 Tax=Fibrella aquatilis TaxID=2817059 RepID=A0A939G5L8_9BACT|nr:hypothetical protein [Fibrella aquatilis]MBO0931475.1 hypothetical protein [Fibrella aquatilis]